MTVTGFGPFRDAVSLRQAMDRLFEDSVVRPAVALRRGEASELPINVWEDQDSLHLVARVPGLAADDIELTITGDTLTVRGNLSSDAQREDSKDWRWYANELWYGPFERTITLPTEIQADKVDATFKDGVLHLTLPKAEEVKPKSIKVKVAQ